MGTASLALTRVPFKTRFFTETSYLLGGNFSIFRKIDKATYFLCERCTQIRLDWFHQFRRQTRQGKSVQSSRSTFRQSLVLETAG
jgi:hypothetical protein